MVVSDLSVDVVKNYLRVDDDADDLLVGLIIDGAIRYCETYTGKKLSDFDESPDMVIAVLGLCADMYENRQHAVTGNMSVNPTTSQILGSHSVNLI